MEKNLGDTTAEDEVVKSVPDFLLRIAKAMRDLDDLVRLLGKGLSRTKPWQRHLAGQLGELDRLLQVLRMTVVLERSEAEILDAAEALCVACRTTAASTAGSRCDRDVKTAVHLVAGLASGIRDELRRMDSTDVAMFRLAM